MVVVQVAAGPWNANTSPAVHAAGGDPDSLLNTGSLPSGDCGGVNMPSSMPRPRSASEPPSLPMPDDEDVDSGGDADDGG